MHIYGQLKKADLESLSSAPTPASRGRIYFDTTLGQVRFYNGTSWGPANGSLITGSYGSPQSITAAGGFSPSGALDETIFFKSNSGEVTVSANPQIAAGSVVGQMLTLFGVNDTDYVILSNGNGLKLQGNWYGKADKVLKLMWQGTVWAEVGRNA